MMILYFSATGNCKYVAERLAEALSDEADSILEIDGKAVADVSGIVSPTYAWGIPSIVEDFLQSHTVQKKNDYLFFIATYGTTTGQSGHFANAALEKSSGISFDTYFSVKMPDTWTPTFDLSDKTKVTGINEDAEKQIDNIIEQIRHREKPNHMRGATPAFTRFIYRPYYNHMRRTDNFHVEDTCIGCGLCEKKCPVEAIEMKDGRPAWIKEKCVMCLGCLHRCPKFAIQYGKSTKRHGQYINPHVTW